MNRLFSHFAIIAVVLFVIAIAICFIFNFWYRNYLKKRLNNSIPKKRYPNPFHFFVMVILFTSLTCNAIALANVLSSTPDEETPVLLKMIGLADFEYQTLYEKIVDEDIVEYTIVKKTTNDFTGYYAKIKSEFINRIYLPRTIFIIVYNGEALGSCGAIGFTSSFDANQSTLTGSYIMNHELMIIASFTTPPTNIEISCELKMIEALGNVTEKETITHVFQNWNDYEVYKKGVFVF